MGGKRNLSKVGDCQATIAVTRSRLKVDKDNQIGRGQENKTVPPVHATSGGWDTDLLLFSGCGDELLIATQKSWCWTYISLLLMLF
jgi:hypothetical protein